MMQRRDQEHPRLWQAAFVRLREEMARLKTAVDDKQAELDARPVQVVTENLDVARVAEALAERDRAYQSRDRAFSLLSAAVLLHQPDERSNQHRCVCGVAWSACAVGQLLEDEGRGLRNWESKQREWLLAGNSHWLPDNHPYVLDRRTAQG